jgi:tripartite-type tricarboxylate transporter receptor subunit TctC
MKLPRRKFLHLAAGAAALPAVSRMARAQAYPTRPVRYIVSAPPAGAQDILARLMGQWLSERLGQQFVIDNRPGGGTNIGTEAVVRAPPDGYTLLSVALAAAVNATLYEKLNFNFIRDIAPVAGIMRVGLVVVVTPSVPVNTIPELITYTKANSGKVNMASAGNGTTPHMAGELFKLMTGVDIVHVPYRGEAPALTDLLGGQVQVMFGSETVVPEQIRAGKLRALAVTTARRSQLLPELSTVGDFVPGYEASGWFGVGAPARTPVEIIDKLNKEINAGLADPKIKARLADLGGAVLVGSPAVRLRETCRRRNREVGQGGEVRRPQAGLTQSRSRSILSVPRSRWLKRRGGGNYLAHAHHRSLTRFRRFVSGGQPASQR